MKLKATNRKDTRIMRWKYYETESKNWASAREHVTSMQNNIVFWLDPNGHKSRDRRFVLQECDLRFRFCLQMIFLFHFSSLAHSLLRFILSLPLRTSVSFTLSHSMVHSAQFQMNACTVCTFFSSSHSFLSLILFLCSTVHFAFYSCSKRHKTK